MFPHDLLDDIETVKGLPIEGKIINTYHTVGRLVGVQCDGEMSSELYCRSCS